jgi:hypothetical protein
MLNVTAPKGLPHLKLTATAPRKSRVDTTVLDQLVIAATQIADEGGLEQGEIAAADDLEMTVSESIARK